MDIPQILVPAVTLVLGALLSWYGQELTHRRNAELNVLRKDKREIYLAVLDPFINTLLKATDLPEGPKRDAEMVKLAKVSLASHEAKINQLKLTLMGSDKVVKAWNDLLHPPADAAKDQRYPLQQFCRLLNLMRRDLGIRSSSLSNNDMIQFLVRERMDDLST